jgi:adhesin transport system outer membrane protein
MKMKFAKYQRFSLSHVLSACLSLPMTVSAQSVSDNAVLDQRERTRNMVESVTADQPGGLDDASSLGRTLPAQMSESMRDLSAKRPVPGEAKQPARPAGAVAEAVMGLPAITAPSAQRLLRRAKSPLAENNATRPVFTPDFSRQKLTLAELTGRTVLDLPNVEQISPQAIAKPNPEAMQKLEKEAFNLADMVQIGLSYSPVMQQVDAQLEAAQFQAKQARSDLLPSFSYRRAAGPERSFPTGSAVDSHYYTSAALRITQPLVSVPNANQWLSTLSAEQAATWRVQASREAVALAVVKASIDLASARIVLDFSDELLKQLTDVQSYVEARAQAGASSQADLERARTRVLAARQSRIEQQANYKNAYLEIQRLTGQDPVGLHLPYLNQLPGLPSTQSELRQIVRDESFDLRAMREDLAAQQRAVRAEYSKLLPALGLSAEQDNNANVRGTNAPQMDRRLLLVMTWNFSLGGKEIYSGKQAEAELTNRQARLDEETQKALQSADADFALLQSATLRLQSAQSERQAATKVVDAVQEQLRTGRLGSLLDALDASERLFAARQRVLQTLTQQMQAQAQLARRLGALSPMQNQAQVSLEPATPVN